MISTLIKLLQQFFYCMTTVNQAFNKSYLNFNIKMLVYFSNSNFSNNLEYSEF